MGSFANFRLCGLNTYAYAGANPLGNTDPMGLCSPGWLCSIGNFFVKVVAPVALVIVAGAETVGTLGLAAPAAVAEVIGGEAALGAVDALVTGGVEAGVEGGVEATATASEVAASGAEATESTIISGSE